MTRSVGAFAMVIAAMGCGPGPSSEIGRVPEASLPRPVVLGDIEMCGEALSTLDLLHGSEHPAWDPMSDEQAGHVRQWHVFAPRHLEGQEGRAAFAFGETVCGRTAPDVLTIEVVDGMVAEVNAVWAVPPGDAADGLWCKQALEVALGSAKGEPATSRDEWAEREMALWVWSEPGVKTEVLIDTYDGTRDWSLLDDIPSPGREVDSTFRPDDMAVGDLRVLMRFRCTPIVQQLARDALREETGRN